MGAMFATVANEAEQLRWACRMRYVPNLTLKLPWFCCVVNILSLTHTQKLSVSEPSSRALIVSNLSVSRQMLATREQKWGSNTCFPVLKKQPEQPSTPPMPQQRLCSSSGLTRHHGPSPSPRFSSFSWSSECSGEDILLIWSKQDTTPMLFKEISKELSAAGLSGVRGGAPAVTQTIRAAPPLAAAFTPPALQRNAHVYSTRCFSFRSRFPLTESRLGGFLCLALQGHPPCTHLTEDTRPPPPWGARALFHQHLLLPPGGSIFISTAFLHFLAPLLLWLSHVPRHRLLGFSSSAVTSLSKKHVGSIWEQTPFHTDGNSHKHPDKPWLWSLITPYISNLY